MNAFPHKYTSSTVGAGYVFNIFIYDPDVDEASDNNPIVFSTGRHSVIGIDKRKNVILSN